MLAREVLTPAGLRADVVHVHFHDTDLVDPRRRAALAWSLRVLARRRRPPDLDALAATLGANRPQKCLSSRSQRADRVPSPRADEHGADRHRAGGRAPATDEGRVTRRRPPTSAVRISTSSRGARGSRSAAASASIAALAALDAIGLTLGLYVALVVRELVYGHPTIYWSLLWEGPKHWLRFLIPITLIVFWQAGLYASRERRPGAGKIVSSLVLVAAIVLAFGIGTGHHFSTTGPRADRDGGRRDRDRRAALRLRVDLARAPAGGRGAPARRSWSAKARASRTCTARSARRAAASSSTFLGAVTHPAPPGLPVLGGLDELPAILESTPMDELILSEGDFDERRVLEMVEAAHRRGVKVRLAPRTTELLVQQGEYVPGQGVPLFELRPPGADRRGLGGEADVRPGRVGASLRSPGCRSGSSSPPRSSSTRAGPVFFVDRRMGVGEREFGMLKFRTMVAGAAERQDELERPTRRAGRSSRSATTPA